MINSSNKKILNFLIIIILGLQFFILIFNQKPLTQNFSQKAISVENFSSIVLSNSGITKIKIMKYMEKIYQLTYLKRYQIVMSL